MSDIQAKILVIDDDSSMLELSRINLNKLGHEVVIAQNAQQGIDTYQEQLDQDHSFDIVIIDLRLDGVKMGTSVAEDILGLNPDAKLIVSSGDSNNPAMLNFEEYGFKGRLEKDFNRERMRSTIQDVLGAK